MKSSVEMMEESTWRDSASVMVDMWGCAKSVVMCEKTSVIRPMKVCGANVGRMMMSVRKCVSSVTMIWIRASEW